MLTVVVNVLETAASVVNTVVVAGGGDQNAGNNSFSDFTSINVSPDPTIALSLDPSLVVGQNTDCVAQVTNLGPGGLGGETRVVALLPDGLIPMFGAGGGWRCETADRQFRCSRNSPLAAGEAFPPLTFRLRVATDAGSVSCQAAVIASADANPENNVAEATATTVPPTMGLTIAKTASTDRVAIGGTVFYRVEVRNTGDARVLQAVVRDLLPRGFKRVDQGTLLQSSNRTTREIAAEAAGDELQFQLGTIQPGEIVTLIYTAIVGADARTGPQANRATVGAIGPGGVAVTAGPAVASVDVTSDTFSMLQVLVGRVFEDVDRNGVFNGADRPVANARIITSTGQAVITDPLGLYNIPSLPAGSVAVSLDRDTVHPG